VERCSYSFWITVLGATSVPAAGPVVMPVPCPAVDPAADPAPEPLADWASAAPEKNAQAISAVVQQALPCAIRFSFLD
jgi:hypothetical protein